MPLPEPVAIIYQFIKSLTLISSTHMWHLRKISKLESTGNQMNSRLEQRTWTGTRTWRLRKRVMFQRNQIRKKKCNWMRKQCKLLRLLKQLNPLHNHSRCQASKTSRREKQGALLIFRGMYLSRRSQICRTQMMRAKNRSKKRQKLRKLRPNRLLCPRSKLLLLSQRPQLQVSPLLLKRHHLHLSQPPVAVASLSSRLLQVVPLLERSPALLLLLHHLQSHLALEV